MHTSAIRHSTGYTSVRLAQKSLIVVAAVLALVALFAHHPGLAGLVALAAVLSQQLVARISEVPSQSPHTPGPLRITDGGSIRNPSGGEALTDAAQRVVVTDGGSH